MYDRFKDIKIRNKYMRSRLFGITQIINQLCKIHKLEMPEYKQYKNNFDRYYQINNDHTIETQQKIKKLLNRICYDSFIYINDAVPWGSQRWSGINDNY